MEPTVREPAAAYPAPRVLPRHTWEDYSRWEGDWELIRGVPFAMSPSPKVAHFRVADRLRDALKNGLKATPGLTVVAELDWIVDNHTTLRPDVMVAEEPVGDDWLRKPPLLLAEVLSPSTAAKDRIEKRSIAEEQRVPWFVLIDPASRAVEAWRWTEQGYRDHPLADGVLRVDLAGTRVAVSASDLFP